MIVPSSLGMTDEPKSYENDAVVVTFDTKVCIHSGKCVRGLGAVFDVKRRPWIAIDGATPEAILAQVAHCPSGALKARLK